MPGVGKVKPSAPTNTRPPPPPYTPFYTEQSAGDREMVEHIAIDVTPRDPAPTPSPRRLVNVNVTVPPPAQAGRRSHEPVIVSPLVLSPQLHTIPLTVENIQYHDD